MILVAGAALAQGPKSPPKTAEATIGGKKITIKYSAPSVRERKIFGEGGLVAKDPTYPVWRLGANSATSLHTDGTLQIGSLTVPPGDYTLFAQVNASPWELIVNKQTGQWGLSYDAKQDLGRVKLTMSKPASMVEQFRIVIEDAGGGKGKLVFEWENTSASVGFTAK